MSNNTSSSSSSSESKKAKAKSNIVTNNNTIATVTASGTGYNNIISNTSTGTSGNALSRSSAASSSAAACTLSKADNEDWSPYFASASSSSTSTAGAPVGPGPPSSSSKNRAKRGSSLSSRSTNQSQSFFFRLTNFADCPALKVIYGPGFLFAKNIWRLTLYPKGVEGIGYSTRLFKRSLDQSLLFTSFCIIGETNDLVNQLGNGSRGDTNDLLDNDQYMGLYVDLKSASKASRSVHTKFSVTVLQPGDPHQSRVLTGVQRFSPKQPWWGWREGLPLKEVDKYLLKVILYST
jgi:hypothetical protein